MPITLDGTTGITAAAFDGALAAADLTGTLPALNGSALTNLPAPTSAQVGTATAGLAAGAVGTYVFARRTSSTDTFSFGATVAGSGLFPHGINLLDSGAGNQTGTAPGSALSGTWMAMGSAGTAGVNANYRPASLWLRIS
jgi:hypothetical protein